MSEVERRSTLPGGIRLDGTYGGGRAEWVPAALLGAFALFMAWYYGGIDYLGEFAHVDLAQYRLMAQASPELTFEARRPFVYRILGPWLAGVMPMPDPQAFRLLTVSTLVVLVAVFYGWLSRYLTPSAPAAVTTLLLILNPYVFGFVAFNYFQLADALVFLLMVVALVALYEGRWLGVAISLALGVLAREPAILLLPVVFVFLWERGWLRKSWWRAALAVSPAIVLFVGLRMAIDPGGGNTLVQTFILGSQKALWPETWYRLLINAWAPLALVPFVFWRTTARFFRGHLHLLLLFPLVLVSAFFGGDQERLVAPAFITVYAVVAVILARDLWAPRWMPWLVLGAAALTSLHHLTARFPLPERWMTIVLSVIALVVVTGAAVWIRMRSAPREAARSTI